MYECVGSSLRRSLRRPDAVVVDDDMGVEVRLQEGPSGAVAGSRLEPSREPRGQGSLIQAFSLNFELKARPVKHPRPSLEVIMKLHI